jgi:NarL family two-component system response regulator LiaR
VNDVGILPRVQEYGRAIMTITILIADDHEIVRDGLRTLLELDPELRVVGEAANGTDAVKQVLQLQPDVVLMDLLMPDMDGLAATRQIRADLPHTEVVALTSVLEGTSGMRALEAGAITFLLKDTRADELRRAIKAAAAGQVQIPRLLGMLRAHDGAVQEPPPSVTEADRQVLRLLANGLSNADMASVLGGDEVSVRATVNDLLSRLAVTGRTQAVLYAGQLGLCDLIQVARVDRDTQMHDSP